MKNTDKDAVMAALDQLDAQLIAAARAVIVANAGAEFARGLDAMRRENGKLRGLARNIMTEEGRRAMAQARNPDLGLRRPKFTGD